VRSLEKHIDRIARKIAFGVVSSEEVQAVGPATIVSDSAAPSADSTKKIPSPDSDGAWTVSSSNLEVYLGKPRFPQVRFAALNSVNLIFPCL